MKVHTDIAGSTCVIQMRNDWEQYVDARDACQPNFVHIEYVRNGQVRFRDTVLRRDAPVIMLELARKFQ